MPPSAPSTALVDPSIEAASEAARQLDHLEALRRRRRFGRQVGLAFALALALCLVMLARTS